MSNESPEEYRERVRGVWVVNESNQVVVLTYNKAEFEFPPGTADKIMQECAWLWFGNKKTQQEGPRAWDREVNMLRQRHGAVPMIQDPRYQDKPDKEIRDPDAPKTNWELIEQGLLYCREFGKADTFYRDVETNKPIRFVATMSIAEMQATCGVAGTVQPMGVAATMLGELEEAAENSANRGDREGAMLAAVGAGAFIESGSQVVDAFAAQKGHLTADQLRQEHAHQMQEAVRVTDEHNRGKRR